VTSLGARPVAIDAGAHDRLVAVTSHVPHALANVLLNQAGATRVDGHDPVQAAGGSLRDMTRIAGANPRVWVDIFLDNRDALSLPLAGHKTARSRRARARATSSCARAGRACARGGGRRLSRPLDRRGERASPEAPRVGVRRPRRAA